MIFKAAITSPNRFRLARRAAAVLLALPLLLVTSRAGGQTVDPRTVEFDPSADHNTVLTGGQAAVSRYDFELYYQGAAQPFQVMDLGKPVPEVDGKIRVDFLSFLSSWPLPGITYEARVNAIGPAGNGESAPSNAFTFSGPCANVVSAPTLAFPAAGGPGSVDVFTGTGCTWSASSSAGWVTVPSGTISGNATMNVNVAPNTTTTQRTATLTAGSASVLVTQAASVCAFAVSPTTVAAAAGGAVGTLGVTVASGCSWTAVSAASWIAVTSGATGSGAGSTGYTVAANTSTSPRTGTVTIAGTVVTVTQAGVACSFAVSPTNVSAAASGGTGSLGVTAASGCSWTAVSAAPWIAVTSGAAGSGAGSTGYTVAANPSASPRTGTVTIAGTVVTVTQAGVGCTYALSSTTFQFSKSGGTGSVMVTTNPGCGWTVTSSATWVTPAAPASGTGNGTLSFTVARNRPNSPRTGTLTVAGRTVTINQD